MGTIDLRKASNEEKEAMETMNVNSQYLVRNGESWFPIIGEFHHNRY